jgi:predicted DNA-binding transcriptional regulator AlpA
MTRAGSSTVGLPDLLSASELAAYLGVPVSTLYYWRGKGGGPKGFKLGKRVVYRAADVATWLDFKGGLAAEMREAGFPASEPLADENVDGNSTP